MSCQAAESVEMIEPDKSVDARYIDSRCLKLRVVRANSVTARPGRRKTANDILWTGNAVTVAIGLHLLKHGGFSLA